jgi:parvulin-like peptidyl-prolyl isomerase
MPRSFNGTGDMLTSRFMLALCGILLAAAAPTPDPVVAVRGDQSLTASQVRALIASADPDTRKQLQSNPEALQRVIRDSFLQRAVLAAAEQAKWDDKPEVAALLRRTREAAIIQSFLAAQAPVPASYPSEAELQAGYEKAKPQLMQPRTYHLAQAFIAVAAGASADEARHKLASLQKDVTAGRVSWDAAAKRAGAAIADLGWVPEDRLQASAREAASGLLEGQISSPVCTPSGCSALKLLGTRPAGPAPLADVRDKLIAALRQAKQRAGEQAYADGLLAKEPVRINEIELSHVTAP